ncbi:MAG: manganese efflux pump [Clostridia bacterium]|nr:manganese efflux pump [Clostridia bacterium]
MLFYILIIGLSSSIDAIGIGITYGLKKIKISNSSNLILFIISILVTSISMIIGNTIRQFIPIYISHIAGSLILSALGIFMIFNTKTSDLDNSKDIDSREAVLLGLAISLDSFGVIVSSAVAGIYTSFLPIYISALNTIFIKLGNCFGHKLIKKNKYSDNIWSKISGILLIIIGILKLKF